MKILNYVQLIDSELFAKKHKNNQKIRKSSGTVRRGKIELVRLSSVRFENLLKFDSFTVINRKNKLLPKKCKNRLRLQDEPNLLGIYTNIQNKHK